MSTTPPADAGEDTAAAEGILLDAADRLSTEARRLLVSEPCRLPWDETTYGRMFSLAALSHECVLVDHMALGVRQKFPSSVMALVCRSHLETWLTGAYLLLGGQKATETFLGQTTTAHGKLRRAIEELHAAGKATDIQVPPLEDFDWAAQSWNFFEVARELETIGGTETLFTGALALYQVTYRSLSGSHGSHPTHAFLDSYIETPGNVGRVLLSSQAPVLRRRLLQYALALSAVHASLAFGERGLPVDAFSDVYVVLMAATGS